MVPTLWQTWLTHMLRPLSLDRRRLTSWGLERVLCHLCPSKALSGHTLGTILHQTLPVAVLLFLGFLTFIVLLWTRASWLHQWLLSTGQWTHHLQMVGSAVGHHMQPLLRQIRRPAPCPGQTWRQARPGQNCGVLLCGQLPAQHPHRH